MKNLIIFGGGDYAKMIFNDLKKDSTYNILGFFDDRKNNSLKFRTLFIQEMLKHNILMPWISIAYRHNDKVLDKTQLND